MADNGGQRRATSDMLIIGVILLLVVALVIWFVFGRPGGDEGGVDIDINVPGASATSEGPGG